MTMEFNERKAIPRERGLPFIGSALDFKMDGLAFVTRLASKQGDICAFRIGATRAVMLNNADYARQVLYDSNHKFSAHRRTGKRTMEALLGQGIIFREGSSHKQHRKQLNQFFHPRQLAKYTSAMAETVDATQKQWNDGDEIELFQSMKEIALSVLGRSTFENHDPRALSRVATNFEWCFQHLLAERNSFVKLPDSWPTSRRAQYRRALGELKDGVEALIERGRQPAEGNGDYVSFLLRIRDEDGNPLTVEQMRDEIQTLIFGGYETSANLLTWAFYYLTRDPDNYRLLQEEADRSSQGEVPPEAELQRSNQASRIAKESLRLQPSVPMIRRWCTEETFLGNCRLAADTLLLISPYLLHRKSEYFPDPMEFKPERFTPEMEKALPRAAYIPFGAGPRVCLGASLAMLESEIILSTLAQRVTFELIPGQRVEPDGNGLTLRPRNGIRVRVRRRNHQA
jgi:cytochrome P450